MKPIDRRVRAIAISLVAASALSASPRAGDRVRIVSVSPESVQRGMPVELTVVAEGDLESLPAGLIQLGFNDSDVSGFHMVDRKEIGHGVTRVEFKHAVVPVDWGSDGRFAVMVNIGGPKSNPWQPLASAKHTLTVLGAGAAAAPRDSIHISSISPADPVARGVPQTFRVEVDVALHSLDSAVAVVAFNSEGPVKWSTRDPQAVGPGHRHLTFNVRTIPVEWGMGGPFSVRVFLGAKPPERPVASDTRLIPLKP